MVGWGSVCTLKYALCKCTECDKNKENGGEFNLDLVSLTFLLTFYSPFHSLLVSKGVAE